MAMVLLLISATLPAAELKPVDFAVLQKHAMFAQAVYQNENHVRATVEAEGFTLTLLHTVPDTQISFFLATNALTKTQVISIRGTSNIDNAVHDMYLKLVADTKAGIRLHEGFSFLARKVYARLKPLLKPSFKINVTGHSMGGAVAVILALYLDGDQYDIEQVTTFGQPKVTNVTGAGKIQHINVVRVVTPLDLVPIVPLFDPLNINNIEVYWHSGKEIILLAGEQYAILEGTESMLRATGFTQRLLNEQNLQHHQMSLYLKLIAAKVQSSTLVPYRNTTNLFNLFGTE